MVVKLINVIFILLIKLVGIIFALSIEVLANVIFTLLLKKPYISSRADRYYLYSINKIADKYYPYIIIESH